MRCAIGHRKRIVRAVGAAATAVALTAAPAAAQRAPADTAPSACWQFAFGEWSPPLDWNRAGHPGTDSAMATRVQRIRDSVFDHDPVATRNSAMEVQRTPQGLRVMLYPGWWPAGLTLTF
ncbi:MAG: hypothetical protein U9Q74_08710, partial [Gemmatimonadota bacterium]|nr:hypothetical protein [Gemmatimonadota bacterium]